MNLALDINLKTNKPRVRQKLTRNQIVNGLALAEELTEEFNLMKRIEELTAERSYITGDNRSI